MEEKHGKIQRDSVDLSQNQDFCCMTGEERLKEWQKAMKLGCKTFPKMRKQQKNTAKILEETMKPAILCDKCYRTTGLTEELTMGKSRDSCDNCGEELKDYHWIWASPKSDFIEKLDEAFKNISIDIKNKKIGVKIPL